MIMKIGLAMLMIWCLNLMYLLYEILKHTPNWKEEEVDSDEIVQNFMTNTPLEKLEKFQFIASTNPMFGYGAALLLLMALII